MDKIGIVGLGLIGCGIARSLKGKYEVVGVDSDREATEYCLENGFITEQGLGALRGCKAVFVAVPYTAVERTVKQVSKVVGDDVVITDTAAVKSGFGLMPPRFVGGHPLAGSEQSGAKASFDGMFENAFWALTCVKESEEAQTLEPVIRDMGAIPIYMGEAEHDKALSVVSHLPHMIAYALVGLVLADKDNYSSLASGGFLDCTRLASASPDYWLRVARANKENIVSGLDAFTGELKKLREFIAEDNGVRIRAYFADGKRKRDTLLTTRRYRSEYEIYVKIRDEVGALARVTALLADAGADVKSIRIDSSREGEGGLLRLGFRSLESYDTAQAVLKENGLL